MLSSILMHSGTFPNRVVGQGKINPETDHRIARHPVYVLQELPRPLYFAKASQEVFRWENDQYILAKPRAFQVALYKLKGLALNTYRSTRFRSLSSVLI